MSVLIVKLKNDNILSTVKNILNVFTKDIAVLKNEEYRDSKFAELLEVGRKSKILTEKETKHEFRKRGITF